MNKTTLVPGKLLRSVHIKKSYSARQVTKCCATDYPPLEVDSTAQQASNNETSSVFYVIEVGSHDPYFDPPIFLALFHLIEMLIYATTSLGLNKKWLKKLDDVN